MHVILLAPFPSLPTTCTLVKHCIRVALWPEQPLAAHHHARNLDHPRRRLHRQLLRLSLQLLHSGICSSCVAKRARGALKRHHRLLRTRASQFDRRKMYFGITTTHRRLFQYELGGLNSPEQKIEDFEDERVPAVERGVVGRAGGDGEKKIKETRFGKRANESAL